MTRLFAFWFRLKGWKVAETIPPEIRKCVVVAAPHSSNWDFVFALAAIRILKLKVNYLAKQELFRFPLGYLLRQSGGIPVERSRHHNLVAAMIQKFQETDSLYLVIPPEGTRKTVKRWKSGFYHVAEGAGVPVMLAYLDYKRKVAGFGKVFHVTGDKIRDMDEIRAFYRQFTPRHPDKFDPESIRIE